MSCADLVRTSPVTLHPEDSLLTAIQGLLKARQRSLPVIGNDGELAGMLGIHRILDLALPEGAGEDGLGNAAFLHDRLDDLVRRFQDDAETKVAALMNPEPDSVTDSESLSQVVLKLDQGHDTLPVLDATGKFLGIVTYWEVLARIVRKLDS